MTQQEYNLTKQSLEERLLNLASIMAKSDNHASKCAKLGLSFQKEYPTEYDEYCEARISYNKVEEELALLEEVEIEDLPMGGE